MPAEIFCDSSIIKKQLVNYNLIELTTQSGNIAYHTVPQPAFNKQFDLLVENLKENEENGYTSYLFCGTAQQAKRFKDIFDDMGAQVQYETVVMTLFKGFIDHDLKIACYTDHQIFDRYHKFKLKNGYAKNKP
ncbi:transcription-repair coupling factor [Nonlabens ulvanivorans]|nr:transcription-repair coupling factor [Nonlabens ulvanivorans]